MLEGFMFALVSLTVIYNPFSKPPILLSLTDGMKDEERAMIVNRAVAIAWVLGVLVLLFGFYFLDVLNIRMSSFKIFGGLMLLVFGIQFGLGLDFGTKRARGFDVAAVPLASPLLTGPGAISAIMLLSVDYGHLVTILALTGCLFICYLFMRFSKLINRILNEQTVKVISRLMGMILVAFAVQFMTSGLNAPLGK